MSASGTAREKESRWNRLDLLTLAAVILGAAPLCIVHVAGIEDWPSHLARAGMLHEILTGDAFWRRYYDRNTFLLPNVALDLLLLGLSDLGLRLNEAGTVALIATYALFVSGAGALAASVKASRNALLLFASILFYNGALFSGFVNFALGCGVALWCLAVWLRIRQDWLRVLLAAPLAVLTFFSHLIAAGMFLVVLGSVDLAAFLCVDRGRLSRVPARLSAPLGLVCAAGLLRLSPTEGDLATQGGFSIAEYLRQFGQPAFYIHKIAIFLHAFFDGGGIAGSVVLLTGLVMLAAAMWWSRRSGRLDWRISTTGATLAGVSLLLFLLAPNKIGNGMGLDYRLPPFLALCMIAWASSTARQRSSIPIRILLFASVARSLVLSSFALADAGTFDSFHAVVPQIKTDSVMLAGVGTPRDAIGWTEFWRPAAEYLGTTAAAAHVFVPSVWALPTQHPLVLKSEFAGWGPQFDVSTAASLAHSRQTWDVICQSWRAGHTGEVYALISYPSAASDAAFPQQARIASGPGWRLIAACPTTGASR